jgi:hypothetical protein
VIPDINRSNWGFVVFMHNECQTIIKFVKRVRNINVDVEWIRRGKGKSAEEQKEQ